MTLEERIKNTVSMAQRAGKIASGAFAVEKAFQENAVKLLLIAEDATADSRDRFHILADKNHVPNVICMSRASLGGALGKGLRSAAAILDEGFKKSLLKITEEVMKE